MVKPIHIQASNETSISKSPNNNKNTTIPKKINNNLERNPISDEYKKGLSNEEKLGIGAGIALAIFTAGDLLLNKGRLLKKLMGKADDSIKNPTATSNIKEKITNYSFKKGKVYNANGELLTGSLTNVSKSGNKMECHYIDGILVKREFTPANQTNVKKIVKSYDTQSHEGVRISFSEIEKADGTIEYKRIANFTENKFPAEIEAKIKMKDFDNTEISKLEEGTKDLGDGVTLDFDGDFYNLKQNGKLIRRKTFFSSGYTAYRKGSLQLWKNQNGSYDCFMIDKPNGFVVYTPDGHFHETIMYDEKRKMLDKFITKYYDALGKLKKES